MGAEDSQDTNGEGDDEGWWWGAFDYATWVVGGIIALYAVTLSLPFGVFVLLIGWLITPHSRGLLAGEGNPPLSFDDTAKALAVLVFFAAGLAPGTPGGTTTGDGQDAGTGTATTTAAGPSIHEIGDRLHDQGLVVLSISEEDGDFVVVTEMQYTKAQDRQRIELVAQVYAEAVADGYSKKIYGAVSTVGADRMAQYRIFPDDAREYNRDEVSLQAYVDEIMAGYRYR